MSKVMNKNVIEPQRTIFLLGQVENVYCCPLNMFMYDIVDKIMHH